jgi:hypothetical protein
MRALYRANVRDGSLQLVPNLPKTFLLGIEKTPQRGAGVRIGVLAVSAPAAVYSLAVFRVATHRRLMSAPHPKPY